MSKINSGSLPAPIPAVPGRAAIRRRVVVVAMSGGVDSCVTAALLKSQGHEVIGITLQLYEQGEAARRSGACCAGQDIHDARRVAEHLAIPHYVLDYQERFRQSVIEPFAASYLAGETPIPCVACNREIKFRDLLDAATELGADALATGHYVDRRDGPDGPALYRAADAGRDQSYFLFATTPDQLARLMFPLGALMKPAVRRFAAELALPVADKPDSQDICFVGSGGYAAVIEKLNPGAATPGAIVDVEGRVLGRHDGIMRFTVGQRRGLNLSSTTPDGEPLFVVRLDPARAEVVVGPKRLLAIDSLRLREVNWLGVGTVEAAARAGLPVHVRVRSTQQPRPARLAYDPVAGAISVRMDSGEFGVAKGQACVLYADGHAQARVLGGGFIAATARSDAALECGARAIPAG